MIGRGIGIPFRHGTGGGGTSIPPEIKKSIVAWYDPKKQGMTNYDVIESYAEDFTASKWVTVQDRAVFTKTASKIHITESMSNGFNTSFIETRQSRYGNEMKINVSGIVAGGVTLKYRYGSYEEVVDITSNGVYTLPAGKAGTNPNGYNGFVMKAKGKCDITITQIPDYPDQLCYDGNMCAVAYEFPILTDYTVMAERTWFEKEEYSAFISNSLGGIEDPNNGAFCVEIKSLNSFTTSSFGSLTSIGIPEKG
jgi:hypothetical protein